MASPTRQNSGSAFERVFAARKPKVPVLFMDDRRVLVPVPYAVSCRCQHQLSGGGVGDSGVIDGRVYLSTRHKKQPILI